jgi:hypothetical protein
MVLSCQSNATPLRAGKSSIASTNVYFGGLQNLGEAP